MFAAKDPPKLLRKAQLGKVKGILFRKYDPYPTGHPATEYVWDIFSQLGLNGDFKLLVGSRWHEINGVCLPDKTIIVSLGAAKTTPEELKALLGHEATHAIQGDHAEILARDGVNGFFYQRTAEAISDLYPIVDMGVNPHAVIMLHKRINEEQDLLHGSSSSRSFHAYVTSLVVDSDATKTALGKTPAKIKRMRGRKEYAEQIEDLPPPQVPKYLKKLSFAKLLDLKDELIERWDVGTEIRVKLPLPPAFQRVFSALDEAISSRIPEDIRSTAQILLKPVYDIEKEELDNLELAKIEKSIEWLSAQEGVFFHLNQDTFLFPHPLSDSESAPIETLVCGDKYESLYDRTKTLMTLVCALERVWEEKGCEEVDFSNLKTAICICALAKTNYPRRQEKAVKLLREIDFSGIDSNTVVRALAVELKMPKDYFEKNLGDLPYLQYEAESWQVGWSGNTALEDFEKNTLMEFKLWLSKPEMYRHRVYETICNLSKVLGVETPNQLEDLLDVLGSYLTYIEQKRLDRILHHPQGYEGLFSVRNSKEFLYALEFYGLLISKWKLPPSELGSMSFLYWESLEEAILQGEYKPSTLEELVALKSTFSKVEAYGPRIARVERLVEEAGIWNKEEILSYIKKSLRESRLVDNTSPAIEGKEAIAAIAFKRFHFDISREGDSIIALSACLRNKFLAHKLQYEVFRKRLETSSVSEIYDDLRSNPYVFESVVLELWDNVVEKISDPRKVWEVVQDYRKEITNKPEKIGAVSVIIHVADYIIEFKEDDSKKIRILEMLMTEKSDEKLAQEMMYYVEDGESTGFVRDNLLKEYEDIFYLPKSIKSAILEKLMFGKDGLATSKKGREYLKKQVLQTVELGDDPVSKVLIEIMDGLFEHADQNIIAHQAISVLVDRILVPPKKRFDWSKKFSSTTSPNKVQKLVLEVEENVSYLLPENGSSGSGELQKMPPLEFALKAGGSLGFVVARSLQGVDTLYDLKPEVSDVLSQAYDSMKGQSNLTLVHTMRKRLPGFEEKVKSIETRLGGGSRAVAAGIITDDGPRALKVLNPNAEFHARNILETLRRASSNISYKDEAQIVLDMVGQWMEEDMYFDRAQEFDERFNPLNDGFKAPNSTYVIKGIKSEGPVDKKFLIEEWPVGAINLTKWTELEKEHDMKEVVGTIVHSFAHQVKTGLVHSNVHPGNIAIREKEIFWYDRNLMLDLDSRDIAFASSVGLLSSDSDALSRSFADYLGGFEQNQGKREDIYEACFDEIKNKGKITSLLVGARKAKASIPLKVLLLSLSIVALDKLARKAGYSSVLEAYLDRLEF